MIAARRPLARAVRAWVPAWVTGDRTVARSRSLVFEGTPPSGPIASCRVGPCKPDRHGACSTAGMTPDVWLYRNDVETFRTVQRDNGDCTEVLVFGSHGERARERFTTAAA